MASRDSRKTNEKVLRAEMEPIAAEDDLEDAPQLLELKSRVAERLEGEQERV